MKTLPCRHCNGTGKEPDQRALGVEMRRKRVAANKSLREVAIAMEFSAPYLSDLELGRRLWNSELIASFEKALK